MEILYLQPEQRLIRTEFDQVRDSKAEHRTLFIYTCPACGKKASFALADLIRNCQSSPPDGSVPILYRAIFDRESRSKKGAQAKEKQAKEKTVTPEKSQKTVTLKKPQASVAMKKPQKTVALEEPQEPQASGNGDKPENLGAADEIFCQDFQCSGCNQPVRIEYTAHLNSMGINSTDINSTGINSTDINSTDSHSLKILRVLEIVLPPFPPKEELLAKLNGVTDLFYSLSLDQPPSAFHYLWLVALLLFPILPGYDSPQDMAIDFFQERKKFDSIIGWSFVWDWIDEGHAIVMRDQFSLWLAMILRFGEAVETALVRMLKIAHLLQQQGMEKGTQTLATALALSLENNCSNEEILARADRMKQLKKDIPSQGKSGTFWESLLMLVLTDDFHPDHLRQIERTLEERNFLLTPQENRSASLLLSVQGISPRACVDRFVNLGEAFNLAMTQREESLVDPAFFPAESHPFQKVVLSLLNENSPLFPFNSSCFSPIALLSALPWKNEDLARESIDLYHYLRSYRKYISPDTSFWVSTALVFSACEEGTCPYLFLFWFLTSLAFMAGTQPQEMIFRTISIHRV
jgi:hypothetical protein